MNSELRTNIPPVFVTRSQFEEVMKRLGFTHVQSSAQHEFWQRNGEREVECIVVPAPESHSPAEHVHGRSEVAEFITGFGRSLIINPVTPTREPNAAVADALTDDLKALGNAL